MEECDLSGLKSASCRCLFSNKDGLWRQQTLDTVRWKLWGKSEADGRSHHRALCPARPGAVSPLLPVTSVPSSAGRPGAHLEKQECLGSPSGITWCPTGAPGPTSGLQAEGKPLAAGQRQGCAAGTERVGDGRGLGTAGPLHLGNRKRKVKKASLHCFRHNTFPLTSEYRPFFSPKSKHFLLNWLG